MADVQTSLEGGAKPTNWGNIKFDPAVLGIPSPNIQLDPREQGKGFPIVKELQTKEERANRMNEEIAKIKFPLKTTVITSAIPLGLAYYSYYNNYSLIKGIGVVVIGSAVAFYGAIIFSGKGGFV